MKFTALKLTIACMMVLIASVFYWNAFHLPQSAVDPSTTAPAASPAATPTPSIYTSSARDDKIRAENNKAFAAGLPRPDTGYLLENSSYTNSYHDWLLYLEIQRSRDRDALGGMLLEKRLGIAYRKTSIHIVDVHQNMVEFRIKGKDTPHSYWTTLESVTFGD